MSLLIEFLLTINRPTSKPATPSPLHVPIQQLHCKMVALRGFYIKLNRIVP